MRYSINFDKLVNRLVPYYMGGRKLILYLQAIIKPMQDINDDFVPYTQETLIEASMTSQIFKFEWYLNRKLKKYFVDSSKKISISNGSHLGVPIYYGNASIPLSDHILMYYDKESVNSLELRYQREKTVINSTSFIVYSPQINTQLITLEQYDKMLKGYIDKYRISNKTYIISYTDNEGV